MDGHDVSGSECVPQFPAHRQANPGGTSVANAELRGLDHKIRSSKLGFFAGGRVYRRESGFLGSSVAFAELFHQLQGFIAHVMFHAFAVDGRGSLADSQGQQELVDYFVASL